MYVGVSADQREREKKRAGLLEAHEKVKSIPPTFQPWGRGLDQIGCLCARTVPPLPEHGRLADRR